MTAPELDAASHLKTIRALMERATVYRALSAPAALAAGVLTLLVSGFLLRIEANGRLTSGAFVWLWLIVLTLATGFNFFLLYRSARRRGDPFATAGMKMALRAVAPPLLAGFILGVLGASQGSNYRDIVSFWALFYGLSLLAMGSFAPRSLVALGAGFFLCGLLSFMPFIRALNGRDYQAALVSMALTFGALHLIYAICVFRMQRHQPGTGDDDGA
jgi:hypothetical protein